MTLRAAQFANAATSAPKPVTATPPTKPIPLRECGVCQSMINSAETTTVCPTCGLVFHTECWQGNWGCCAYGCTQVNILRPAGAADDSQKTVAVDVEPDPFPWDFIVLGLSAVAALVSALTYGIASIVALLAIIVRLCLRGKKRYSILAAALALCAVGFFGGYQVSKFWWSLQKGLE